MSTRKAQGRKDELAPESKFPYLELDLLLNKRCVRKPWLRLVRASKPCITRLYASICFKQLGSQRSFGGMFKMSVSFLCVTEFMTTAIAVTVMITMCLWQWQRTQASCWLLPKCSLTSWLSTHSCVSTRLLPVRLDRQDHMLMTFLKVHFQRDLTDHLH